MSTVDEAQNGDGGGQRMLSDIAYERILEGLFSRRIPAGGFVSQTELVRLVGIPVAPLRDALRVLQAEGVLRIHARSGIEFLKADFELTRSTYQFRSIVERAAVRAFVEMAEMTAIEGLIERHEWVRAAIEAGRFDAELMAELEALEDELHGGIVGTLQNTLIDTTYRRLHNYLRLIRLDRRLTGPLALRTLREHMEILEAARARDADRAEAAVQAHFAAALQRALGMV